MGGGSRKYQYETRFAISDQAEDELETTFIDEYQFGEYKVLIDNNRIYLYYRDKVLAIYDRNSLVKIEKDFIKIRTEEPGILLKISGEGVRRVFSIERGVIYGLIAGDGYIYFAEKEYDMYIKLVTIFPEVAQAYIALFSKVYGVSPRIRIEKREGYEDKINLTVGKKEVIRDYLKYPHKINSENWDVPSDYLNEAGLRGFLSGYLTADGSVHICIRDKNRKGRSKYQLRIEFKSKNLEALQKIKKLVEEKFNISGSISGEYKIVDDSKKSCYKLRYLGKKAEEMIRLIWSYKRKHNIAYRRYKKLKYG